MFIVTYVNPELTEYTVVKTQDEDTKIEIYFCEEIVTIPKSMLPKSLSLLTDFIPELKVNLTPLTLTMTFDSDLTFDTVHSLFDSDEVREHFMSAKNLTIQSLLEAYVIDPYFDLRVLQLMV